MAGTSRTPTLEDRPMNTATGKSAKLGQWCGVVVFAVAMAWVESAVVLYLRSLTQEFDPYQPDQTPLAQGIVGAELVREFATLLMLGSVGWLAGQTWRSRVGLAMVAFGVWDIFYYVFLVPLTGWPRSLLDWDILFLLPLPWWGPVLAPMSIACLMVAGGTMVALRDSPERPIWPSRYTCLRRVGRGRVRALCVHGGCNPLGCPRRWSCLWNCGLNALTGRCFCLDWSA